MKCDVRTTVGHVGRNGITGVCKVFRDTEKAIAYAADRIRNGFAVDVAFALYEGSECLDEGYPKRAAAERDADRLNKGLGLD